MPSDPIDLDALVDTLEREQASGHSPARVKLDARPEAERPAVATAPPEMPSSIEWETEAEGEKPRPQPLSAAAAEPVTEPDRPYEAPPLRFSEEEQDSGRRKTRRRLGQKRRRRKETEVDVEEWADWGLLPLGHSHAQAPSDSRLTDEESPAVTPETAPEETVPEMAVSPEAEETAPTEPEQPSAAVEPDSFGGAVEEFPPVKPAPEPALVSEKEDLAPTRVIVSHAAPEPVKPAVPDVPEPAPNAAIPDQMSMEELVRVESVEDSGEQPPGDPVERLQQTRQEKIRDFVLAGEEETNEPEEEPEEPEEEPEEIDDFRSYEDAQAVRLELQYRRRVAGLSLCLSCLLEAAALVLMLLTVWGVSLIPDMGYLTVQAFVLILLAVLNYSSVAHGVTGLVSLRANSDSAMAVTVLFGLAGVIVHFFHSGAALPAWPALAGLSAVCSAACRYGRAVRMRNNFAFISYPGEKYTASLVTDAADLQEIGRRVSMDGEARVAYFHPTAFLSDYLENSAEEDGSDRWARWLTPLTVLVSLGASLALVLFGAPKGFFAWMEVCGYLLFLSAVPLGLITQLSLRRGCNRMLEKGGCLVGYKAVEEFGSPDGVTLDVSDLYPDECMLLHGIKTFSGMHIDEAIVDAASLSIRAGGPLSRIFRRIIENKLELLSEVDSLVYEQGMGLSGWVNGRRVLVGNRRLLQNHGVDVPSSDYEARYAKNDRQLVYLSTAGELSAMFVVSYQPDEEIREALQELCRARVTLLLRSCDPNITAESLCRDFGLDEYYVEVLPTPAGRICERLMSETSASAPAVLASNGHILGSAMALSVCRSLQVKHRLAQAVGTAAAIGGLLLGCWWALKGIGGYAIPALLYTVAASLVTLAAPAFRRL